MPRTRINRHAFVNTGRCDTWEWATDHLARVPSTHTHTPTHTPPPNPHTPHTHIHTQCHMFFTWSYNKGLHCIGSTHQSISPFAEALTFAKEKHRILDSVDRKGIANNKTYIVTVIVFGVAVGISTALPLNWSVTHVLTESFRERSHYKSQDDDTKC